MLEIDTVIAYGQMCDEEECRLQRGMNYKLNGKLSLILMSLRKDATYADRVEDNKTIIYEGHDMPNFRNLDIDPKKIDQPQYYKNGSLTQNGKFHNAALNYKQGNQDVELVKVYEKLEPNVWVFKGAYKLTDSWQEKSNDRMVFKFKLEFIS